MKITRVSALAAALSLCATGPASFASTAWSLYDRACTGGTASLEIPCGSYGRFLIVQSTAPPGCTPIASGVEDPPTYPTQVVSVFPVHAARVSELPQQPLDPDPPSLRNDAPTRHATAQTTSPATPIDEDWVAVIDFDSAHGESTTWLADQTAGSTVNAALAPLDDPALAFLGPVGDIHVLNQICQLAESVDDDELKAPIVVNMSFGRPSRAADPASHAACTTQNAACQIAGVIHHLSEAGSTFVAAAGNRGSLLFPASLDEVLAAGMLDLNPFMAGAATIPAWETPPGVEAWIPGNALCLSGWPAPAGSSYSSAMLAGWLVKALTHPEVLATLGEGPWVPAWSATRGCYVLAKGRTLTPWCNAEVNDLFVGLSGASATNGCWAASTEPSESVPPPGSASPPDPLPSLDLWGSPTHPTPESDPCVPCDGTMVSGGPSVSDLQLDLSQSGPLPSGIHLDSVALRVGLDYYGLALTPGQIQGIETGGLATLLINGAGSLIPPSPSISLWYRLKSNANASCSSSSGCYWSSTPVLIGP